jgi:thioesterase domain-containing protein/acyl carrier protein
LPGYPFERQHYQLTAARSQSAGRVAEQHPASAGTRNVQPSAGTRNVQRDDTDQNSPAVLGGKHPRPNLPVQYVAPRNELEQAIARIWQETLGIDQPGINDNFVALGGHSLLAIQVATRMRETFEIEFSVTSLYRTPTIAGLSAEVVRLLSKDIDADTVEEVIHRGKALKPEDVIQATGMNDKAMDRMAALSPEKFRLLSRETKKKGPISSSPVLEERALSPLVTIRATGPNPPLFLVHPVGGGVVAYHNLAKYLGDQQPVYAFQNLDQNDRDELNPSSIEAMAAHYSDVICNLSIPEPYLLGGSSMGGIVAFEMALQLSSRGREVGLVALLDSPAHIAPLRLGAANELVKFAEIIAGSSSQKLRFSQDDIERAASAEQVSYVLRKLQEQDLISAYLELAAFTSAFNTFTRNLRALEKYTPRNYTGEVVMLRATDESLDMRKTAGEVWDDPSFGWQAFCTRPVTVHFVPGTHIAMNLEPHVQVVGARLQQCINQVLSEKVTA